MTGASCQMIDGFASTREQALEQLDAFIPQLSLYARDRNCVSPGHGSVSRLSPAIRCRLLLEQEVIAAALAAHRFSRIEKFIQEVEWRGYWKGWLERRPQVWRDYRCDLLRIGESISEGLRSRVREVESGHSGVAIMDHFARELVTTGYLHNHARMWFASFWIHVERLPWQLGAHFFYRHLLDGDPASNTLSWRWVAGLQTRGKAYLVRRSNLEKYCDPSLLIDSTGLERLEDTKVSACIPDETGGSEGLAENESLEDEKSTPTTSFGIWIHEEDLSLEQSPLSSLKPDALLSVLPGGFLNKQNDSDGKIQFMQEAQRDGACRAEKHFGVQADRLERGTHSEAVAEWAAQHKLKSLLAMRPFVGPLRDDIPSLRAGLQAVGCRLSLVDRPEDLTRKAQASSGYFKFWEKVRSNYSS